MFGVFVTFIMVVSGRMIYTSLSIKDWTIHTFRSSLSSAVNAYANAMTLASPKCLFENYQYRKHVCLL